jgi:hypothetical protein
MSRTGCQPVRGTNDVVRLATTRVALVLKVNEPYHRHALATFLLDRQYVSCPPYGELIPLGAAQVRPWDTLLPRRLRIWLNVTFNSFGR